MCAVKIGRLGKFDLNPRGELWRKDENRFGHKLLSKFGWSQGKGLGKNEDGIAENLKVRLKIGNTGVGWDEKLPIGIDYSEYDAVLKDLSKMYQKQGEVINDDISLEKRSQQFKNRIHYQKFVRGKDISRYSEKDMSCIFLSREPQKEVESSPKETTVTNIESYTSDISAKEPMPTFNSQLSITDYFAMKMKNKIGSSLNTPKEPQSLEEPSQSETDVKSKKRKHDFKSSKKAKRMKHEPKFKTIEESLSSEEEQTSESINSTQLNSSQKAPERNLVFREQFQNSEDLDCGKSVKKTKLSSKKRKFLNTLKSKQDVGNNWQENNNLVGGYSTENKNLALDQSHKNTCNSAEGSKTITGNELMSKKRKKDQKSSKKARKHLKEVENSTSFEKNSSNSESDDVDKNSIEECVAKSLKIENESRKESKKHKNKFPSLKGCLKSSLSHNKYSFKQKRNVSFCDNISYKIIENVLSNVDSDIILETNEQLLSCSDEDCAENEALNEMKNAEMNHVDDSISSGKSSEDDEHCGKSFDNDEHCGKSSNDNELCGNQLELSDENSNAVEDNIVPECFKLPKRSSTNYDSWLETQRIAARMKVYKNMVKKMKRHSVLRKTNLLDIKGYGNWGL